MSTKRVIFISRSRLSQNLFEIIVRSIPRKIDFSSFTSLDGFDKAYFPSKVQMVVVDHNCISDVAEQNSLKEIFGKKNIKIARKMLIYSRDTPVDHGAMTQLGFQRVYAKPFLPDELLEVITKQLGIVV